MVTLTLSFVIQYIAPVESMLILMSIIRTYSVQGLIMLRPGLIIRLNLPNSSTIPAKSHTLYQLRSVIRKHKSICSMWGRKGKPNIHRIPHSKYYMIRQNFDHDLYFADIVVNIVRGSTYFRLENLARIWVILYQCLIIFEIFRIH